MRPLNVLVACEESQAVTLAFRRRGHFAFSCDIQECSGGHPEWHIQGDALEAIKYKEWDILIGHPPCTYMSKAGARWMHQGGSINTERLQKAEEAKAFFLQMLECGVPKRAIENPTPLNILELPRHTQAIEPYHFGHEYKKKTLLWLRGLKPLIPTDIKWKREPYLPSNTGLGRRLGRKFHFKSISQKDSSKTFPGIARAMAEQWSPDLGNTWNI